MGEETHNKDHDYKQYKNLWVIDPLDGTLMYQRGVPSY
jgi:fructose-1,6-bisphosphatase/inositol monophosphatase family enzyme